MPRRLLLNGLRTQFYLVAILPSMETTELIRQLTEERNRIDAAMKLLSGLGTTVTTKATAKGKRKKMSAAARKRISETPKKRWAAAKRKKTA